MEPENPQVIGKGGELPAERAPIEFVALGFTDPKVAPVNSVTAE